MNGFSRQCVVIPAASWKAIDTETGLCFFVAGTITFHWRPASGLKICKLIMLRTLGMHVLVKKKTGVIIVR
jgi:hypothetical protein